MKHAVWNSQRRDHLQHAAGGRSVRTHLMCDCCHFGSRQQLLLNFDVWFGWTRLPAILAATFESGVDALPAARIMCGVVKRLAPSRGSVVLAKRPASGFHVTSVQSNMECDVNLYAECHDVNVMFHRKGANGIRDTSSRCFMKCDVYIRKRAVRHTVRWHDHVRKGF